MTSSSIIKYKLSDLLNYGNLFCNNFFKNALKCPVRISSDI